MSGSWSLSTIIRGDELDPPARWIVDHGVHPVALLHLLDTDRATPVGVLAAMSAPELAADMAEFLTP